MKKVIKETYKDMRELHAEFIKDPFGEFEEPIGFYKQSFRDFCYANKKLLVAMAGIVGCIVSPLLFPFAVIIRMFKK